MELTWAKVDGAVALRAHFDAVKRGKVSGPTQVALAKMLELNPNTVYAWKVGFRRPGPELRDALKRILRIKPDSWLTAKELEDAQNIRKVRRKSAA